MAKKKLSRNNKNSEKLLDWHLWHAVKHTINPLPRQKQLTHAKIKKPDIAADRSTTTRNNPKTSNAHPDLKSFQMGNAGTSPKTIQGFGLKTVIAQRLSTAQSPFAMEPQIHRRVRKGRVPIDASIDLHGLNQHDARDALVRFVERRFARGDRTLLIITGKGLKKMGYGAIEQRGVLRHMLPRWLNEPALSPMIAGLETSARQHGGEGAYYVRLKRKKP